MPAQQEKTAEEIRAELEGLKEIKPNVRRYSFFGSDNHAKIDAQITVLEREGMSEDEIFDEFRTDEEIEAAQDAYNWIYGDEEEGLVESWLPLVRKQ